MLLCTTILCCTVCTLQTPLVTSVHIVYSLRSWHGHSGVRVKYQGNLLLLNTETLTIRPCSNNSQDVFFNISIVWEQQTPAFCRSLLSARTYWEIVAKHLPAQQENNLWNYCRSFLFDVERWQRRTEIFFSPLTNKQQKVSDTKLCWLVYNYNDRWQK